MLETCCDVHQLSEWLLSRLSFSDFTPTPLSLYSGSCHITRILTFNINLHSLSCSQAHVQVTNSLSSLKILDFFFAVLQQPAILPLLPVFPLQFSQTLKLPPDLLSLNKLQIIQLPARVRWGSSEPFTTELGTKKKAARDTHHTHLHSAAPAGSAVRGSSPSSLVPPCTWSTSRNQIRRSGWTERRVQVLENKKKIIKK